MIAGAILGGALSALWLIDIVRLRARAGSFAILAPSSDSASEDHVFLTRAGVTVTDDVRRAASAFARKNSLLVVDLVSPRLPAWRALVLLLTVDPKTYRSDRLVRGATAGDALLVRRDLLERVKETAEYREPSDIASFFELGRVLKRYATTESDIAVAPSLETAKVTLRERRRIIRLQFSELVTAVLALQLGALAASIALAPTGGLTALAIYQLQVLAITAGTPLAPSDRILTLFFRVLMDIVGAFGPAQKVPDHAGALAATRSAYDALYAKGMSGFFEPPREDCPVCGGKKLTRAFELGDRFQFKEGRFTVVQCDECGHRFQNPRLSIEGLSFYYRDFYDGLGKEQLESVFSSGPHLYRARAKMVADVQSDNLSRWLDVGAGHGHFCNVAREILPDTKFDGLDLTDSIEDAERRRWVGRGIRGLFPEVAPKLAASGEHYDVVSMSHYLEHTIDQRAEIAAAATVLRDGGLFLIELPDPECGFGRLLGKNWMPWFQPQHLHFLSVKNLERLLREHDFEPVSWHRGEAHHPCELTFLTYIVIENLAPPTDLPWRKPGGAGARWWRRIVWTTAFPWLAVAWVIDRLIAPFARRPGWSNAYRVVSRRVPRDRAA